MKALFLSLQERTRPEDVSELIRNCIPYAFTLNELNLLDRSAAYSTVRMRMKLKPADELRRVENKLQKQLEKASHIFNLADAFPGSESVQPEQVQFFMKTLGSSIGKECGLNDFKLHRLNSASREKVGLDLSRRRYNKLFRVMQRLEKQLMKDRHEQRTKIIKHVGRSQLVYALSWETFSSDAPTAAFIAYYTASSGALRRARDSYQPYDAIAQMLFEKLLAQSEKTNWWAVAHIYPSAAVLSKLTDLRRGALLGTWISKLEQIAGVLREIWEKSDSLHTGTLCIPQRDLGNWNSIAKAWNSARQHWANVVYNLGVRDKADGLWLGKVPRLVAASSDLNRNMGSKFDPDVLVWNELPLIWDVLSGKCRITRSAIEAACRKHLVNPLVQGWISRPPDNLERFRITSELLRGIAQCAPGMKAFLQNAGWVSRTGSQQPSG